MKDNILFYDTETTGKCDFKAKPDAPGQPRLVQLAFIMTDAQGYEAAHFSCLIKPEGWTIDPDAEKLHGITLEMCERMGIPLRDALRFFRNYASLCKGLVCFNSDFDSRIMAGEFLRSGIADLKAEEASCSYPPHFCLMKHMTPICKLPGPYGHKWPKLQEAYRHCFGIDFDGAHNALEDVRATKQVYFWAKKQNAPQNNIAASA